VLLRPDSRMDGYPRAAALSRGHSRLPDAQSSPYGHRTRSTFKADDLGRDPHRRWPPLLLSAPLLSMRPAQYFAIIATMDEFQVLADILLFAEVSGAPPFLPSAGSASAVPGDSSGEARALVAERLRATAEVSGFYGHDPLLTTLAGLRRQRHDLDAAMRRLLAYGREFTRPRPYRLADLADASGMSISGVRTAYDADEIQQVARATGLTTPARPKAHDQD